MSFVGSPTQTSETVPALAHPALDPPLDHIAWMRRAIAEAELARGHTGDNPWVGCVIVDDHGAMLGRGHTLGPGENHAEAAAFREAKELGRAVEGATLYSTLEPCAFHGRTPACSRAIVERGVRRVVTAMRDPHPRVNGAGVNILREGGIEVIEGVCEGEVRHQLGRWVLTYHPHEPTQRARALLDTHAPADLVALLASIYGVEASEVEAIVAPLLQV
jgi:diaminohydroxyphosphoribosylaminopyrimidine deaminase/5-amino-6-(5-phosphoribosylamino)uracil reductase